MMELITDRGCALQYALIGHIDFPKYLIIHPVQICGLKIFTIINTIVMYCQR